MSSNQFKATFFGDSIFFGQGVSIIHGWVTRIAKDLFEYGELVNHEILVTNSSVNGRTTRQALEDMPYTIQSPGVDLLLIQFGLNDCNYWDTDGGLPRVSKGAFRENILEIIRRGKRFGAKKIILSNNHPTTRISKIQGLDFSFEESNEEYSEEVRKLASMLNDPILTFVDIRKYFIQYILENKLVIDKFLLSDGLHLSRLGHDLYYNAMRPAIFNGLAPLVEKI